jgi:dsDNA-binding SOS-regulon protein
MTKAFDKTLDAIDDLEEAITEARTQKLVADPKKAQDLDKIISILEKAQNVIIDAVVIFEKHERAL